MAEQYIEPYQFEPVWNESDFSSGDDKSGSETPSDTELVDDLVVEEASRMGNTNWCQCGSKCISLEIE